MLFANVAARHNVCDTGTATASLHTRDTELVAVLSSSNKYIRSMLKQEGKSRGAQQQQTHATPSAVLTHMLALRAPQMCPSPCRWTLNDCSENSQSMYSASGCKPKGELSPLTACSLSLSLSPAAPYTA